MIEHRIGLLAPFRELPGELTDLVASAREPALLWQAILSTVDSHELAHLRHTGSAAVLNDGIARLRRWRPSVVSFACTSASFVDGRRASLEQARSMEAAAGVPATSTSLAFVEALAALGVDEVALLSPYPEPATDALIDYLGEWGVAVGASTSLGNPSGRASELVGAEQVEDALDALDRDLPTIVPDTAVWGLEIQRALAGGSRPTLLVANQVTLWNAFDLAGMSTDVPALGALAGLRGPGLTTSSATPKR